jgi:hypothetical protein
MPLPDDFGNVWWVILDGYDYAKLAGFSRSAGAGAAKLLEGLVDRNYRENRWVRDPAANVYAAAFPDPGSPTAQQVGTDHLVLPDDPVLAQYGLAAPPGTPFENVGNIPITIPANSTTNPPIPPLHMRLTGNRYLRIGYFSANEDTRGAWRAAPEDWSMLWKFLEDFVLGFLGSLLSEKIDTGGFGDVTGPIDDFNNYQKWMQAALQQDLRQAQQPGGFGNLSPPKSENAVLLALGAVALLLFLLALAKAGEK